MGNAKTGSSVPIPEVPLILEAGCLVLSCEGRPQSAISLYPKLGRGASLHDKQPSQGIALVAGKKVLGDEGNGISARLGISDRWGG